jgi:hypothetical protein
MTWPSPKQFVVSYDFRRQESVFPFCCSINSLAVRDRFALVCSCGSQDEVWVWGSCGAGGWPTWLASAATGTLSSCPTTPSRSTSCTVSLSWGSWSFSYWSSFLVTRMNFRLFRTGNSWWTAWQQSDGYSLILLARIDIISNVFSRALINMHVIASFHDLHCFKITIQCTFMILLWLFWRGKSDYWMGHASKSYVPHCWKTGLF